MIKYSRANQETKIYLCVSLIIKIKFSIILFKFFFLNAQKAPALDSWILVQNSFFHTIYTFNEVVSKINLHLE